MTEPGREPASVLLWSWMGEFVPVSAILALAGVLLVASALGGSSAPAVLAHVLVEAIALYVGYGAVTRVAGPAVLGILVGD